MLLADSWNIVAGFCSNYISASEGQVLFFLIGTLQMDWEHICSRGLIQVVEEWGGFVGGLKFKPL